MPESGLYLLKWVPSDKHPGGKNCSLKNRHEGACYGWAKTKKPIPKIIFIAQTQASWKRLKMLFLVYVPNVGDMS
ncbi:protein of unknown function [uncultured Woeseiaceae bacterium]|uniref:Uncharacterized protein n=1 Tax=uncultured Woeseiaceae bacterium TaxID=1983305 RepID=A0A7D9D297_9GAMM|nr:protein of unknown function [uncultured Woeseiaceae bacterium]